MARGKSFPIDRPRYNFIVRTISVKVVDPTI